MKRESKSMEENEGLVSEPSSESIRQGLKARQLEMCRVISPNEVPKLLGDARTLVLVYCRDATHKVMQRGIPMNSGLDGLDSVGLVNRLWEVANNELMDWLIIPLLNGIIKGGNGTKKLPLLGTCNLFCIGYANIKTGVDNLAIVGEMIWSHLHFKLELM